VFDDFIDQDAVRAADLMQQLGYDRFSVLGWSDGGNSAAALAAMLVKTYISRRRLNLFRKMFITASADAIVHDR